MVVRFAVVVFAIVCTVTVNSFSQDGDLESSNQEETLSREPEIDSAPFPWPVKVPNDEPGPHPNSPTGPVTPQNLPTPPDPNPESETNPNPPTRPEPEHNPEPETDPNGPGDPVTQPTRPMEPTTEHNPFPAPHTPWIWPTEPDGTPVMPTGAFNDPTPSETEAPQTQKPSQTTLAFNDPMLSTTLTTTTAKTSKTTRRTLKPMSTTTAAATTSTTTTTMLATTTATTMTATPRKTTANHPNISTTTSAYTTTQRRSTVTRPKPTRTTTKETTTYLMTTTTTRRTTTQSSTTLQTTISTDTSTMSTTTVADKPRAAHYFDCTADRFARKQAPCPALCGVVKEYRERFYAENERSRKHLFLLSLIPIFLLLVVFALWTFYRKTKGKKATKKRNSERVVSQDPMLTYEMFDQMDDHLQIEEDFHCDAQGPPLAPAKSGKKGFDFRDPKYRMFHKKFIAERRKQEATDADSHKFFKKGPIKIPREVHEIQLGHHETENDEDVKLERVWYNPADNEQYDIGSDVDDIEAAPSTVQDTEKSIPVTAQLKTMESKRKTRDFDRTQDD